MGCLLSRKQEKQSQKFEDSNELSKPFASNLDPSQSVPAGEQVVTFCEELLPQLEEARLAGNKFEEACLLNAIGNTYANGQTNQAPSSSQDSAAYKEVDLDSALKYHRMHQQLAEDMSDQKHICISSRNVGLVMARLKQWPEAMKHQHRSLAAAKLCQTTLLSCGEVKYMVHYHADWSSKTPFNSMRLVHADPACAESNLVNADELAGNVAVILRYGIAKEVVFSILCWHLLCSVMFPNQTCFLFTIAYRTISRGACSFVEKVHLSWFICVRSLIIMVYSCRLSVQLKQVLRA